MLYAKTRLVVFSFRLNTASCHVIALVPKFVSISAITVAMFVIQPGCGTLPLICVAPIAGQNILPPLCVPIGGTKKIVGQSCKLAAAVPPEPTWVPR